MNKKHVLAFVFAAGALTGAQAAERLLVQVPAMLDPGAPIARNVRSECNVEGLVGNQVFAQVAKRWPGTETVAPKAPVGGAKVLRVTLLSVMGTGGGAWSGAKSISVRADLQQNGKTLQTTVLNRQSGGGFWGGTMGTCAIMERIAVTLGNDVAGWMSGAVARAGVDALPAAVEAAPEAPATPGQAVAP